MDADPDRRRRRRGHRARRGPAREGRRGAQDDRPRLADPGDRRHPFQLHAGFESPRRRGALRPAQPRQHRRSRQGRACDKARERARHAAADRRQLRLAAGPSARARVREPGRGAGHGRGRVRRADGASRVHELQGVDEVDQRAEHDRVEPAAVRADPVPAAPRGHRGRDEVVGVAEVGCGPRAPCWPTASATRSGSRSRPSTPRRRSRSPGRSSRRSSCASAGRC